MKPIEFITSCQDNYNAPVGEVMEAITNYELVIRSYNADYDILSYYYDIKANCMVLDIQKRV